MFIKSPRIPWFCICIWKRKIVFLAIIFTFCFYYNQFLQIKTVNRKFSPSPLILLYTYNYSFKTRDNICKGIQNDGHVVNFIECPYKCEFSCRIEDFKQRSPSAVLFFGEDFYWPFKLTDQSRTSLKQRWVFWSWEAPINHPEYAQSSLTFNWTMTYRQDSDVVHAYGHYIERNLSYRIHDRQIKDFYLSNTTNQSTFYVENEWKTRKNKILWIVSNCNTRTKRHRIAAELNQHFPIDQYGQCSLLNNSKNKLSTKEFEENLFQYKFYLAFENAICQDYITEKAFYNALAHGSIPIVLGTHEDNYRHILPPISFIHVEHFKNLKDLANELKHISNSIDIFNTYHQWRVRYRLITKPSNYFIDDLFCNLCTKLYRDNQHKSYQNFSQWLNKCE